MMSNELRILFVEDSPEDVELEERELRKGGFLFQSLRVETPETLLAALREFKPTLIISDFSLPRLDGFATLKIAREKAPDVPFIFVSGTIGEERAIESLKSGAIDYVVKDHLRSLAVKVSRALRQARESADRRRVEDQANQSEKLEAVGRLAGGVARDFNNLLTVINGYAELMLNQLPPDHQLRRHAEEVLEAGQRAAELTRRLMVFGRVQVLSPAVLNLNVYVVQEEKMLREILGGEIELATSLDPALGNVRADPAQIEQILRTLSLNARDAMPRGGKLILETSNVFLDESTARQHPGTPMGRHVMLTVRDTGVGMDPETQSHLFEPFFTTKLEKGAGLGLASVYGIIKQSGGAVWVTSEAGQGSTFKVFLPRVE